jgi:Protein of unknown function (DUF4236)
MGFRLRKAIRIAPGVRLNLSKTGIGVSAGVGPARYSVHSSGRKTVSARTGVPGIYYQESLGSSRGRGGTRAPAPAPPPSKPGLFAPKGEKQLYRAVKAQDIAAIRRVGDEHPDFRTASFSLAGLMLLASDPAQAKTLLDFVFASGSDPAQDPFVSKYLFTRLELSIAEGSDCGAARQRRQRWPCPGGASSGRR